eukprot:7076882-Pyramimonas_sp.AAC.1
MPKPSVVPRARVQFVSQQLLPPRTGPSGGEVQAPAFRRTRAPPRCRHRARAPSDGGQNVFGCAGGGMRRVAKKLASREGAQAERGGPCRKGDAASRFVTRWLG